MRENLSFKTLCCSASLRLDALSALDICKLDVLDRRNTLMFALQNAVFKPQRVFHEAPQLLSSKLK